ncbi:hypothetical protein DFH11DRAFT_1550538 [Phellopilus nigrolimitatus]|nr:hypothetical protein DFH11DRAFT_1550538 [Phellopilus nigrolimitatus]
MSYIQQEERRTENTVPQWLRWAYRQRARGNKPAKHKFTVSKDADVDDDIDGMNVGHYGAEDGFDFRDFKRIVVAEMPIASERFRKAMDAQRTNRLSATNNGTSAAATNAHSNDGVYVAEAGGAVTDRITAQDNIPKGNGASSATSDTKRRATLAGNLVDGDAQPIKDATVLGNSVSQDRKRKSPSNADEKVPRAKGVTTRRAKAGPATRVARKPQAAQSIDNMTEDTGPRTRARTKATQPNNPTSAPTDAPAASTAPANPTSARVRTRAPAPPAKPARKTRQKATQAPVAPPPVPAPPAESVDPSKTRTFRSKRTCALEVPKPKPRTRRTAQQTGALSSEEAGEPKRKPTAGQKRRRDDDDVETPAPTKRHKPAPVP